MLKWCDMLGIIAGSAVGGRGEGEHNRSPASECHQIRSQEVEGQKCSTCHPGSRTPHLYAPAKSRPQIVRCRVKNEGGSKISLQDVHTPTIWVGVGGWVAEQWPSNVTCLCRAARGPSQRANAGHYMRGGSGGRSVCNSHMLSPRQAAIEVDKGKEDRGVMIMPRLMEISCRDRVGLKSQRSWRIRLWLQRWHWSFSPRFQKCCCI